MILVSIHFLKPMNLCILLSLDLDWGQEEKLITLLKENKKAMVWTLGDVEGINVMIV